jgi:CRISPR-associated protein Cmr3
MMTTALFLEPLDQLFFRDGRAFGASTRVVSGLPNPGTLTGALRTLLLSHYGADFTRLGQVTRNGASMEEAFRAAGAPDWIARIGVRGPWLARSRKSEPVVYFQRPRHLRPVNGCFIPARPMSQPLPGWNSPDGLLPLWCAAASAAKESDVPDLLPSTSLAAFCQGGNLMWANLEKQENLVRWDDKTGIQVDPHKLTAEEHMIYGVRMLALGKDVGFYCELTSEEKIPFEPPFSFPFGGESRYVRAERVERIQWPAPPGGANRLLYLISPGLFCNSWKPDVPAGARLQAASVDGPFAVSGWDLARGGPKPTRFGVQPGSVYFYEGGAALPQSLCADPADAVMGYGDFLQGVWNYYA